MATAENKARSFEESLGRLEEIVRELESDKVDLERSVALFQEGRTLVTRCEELLKNAEATLRGANDAPPQPGPPADADDDIPF